MDQAELMAFCVRVMSGEAELAINWMNGKAPALAGKRPLDLMDTQEGRDTIELLLRRVQGGIYI
ncbi:MbcA/ParS/Xre antitoxin family protein [Sulfitobacter faviae]|uniref:MbcA/ParS/Xre antitoxin family protein n=1 Tax=Sulfitobacter faviae TaxID=1775881 RepID=A0ABZ0V232_9RHOB|nr:MbcA/ParS/Xre antitoxin family protein [Sulfitobacter faviae]WPZ22749.1 MbcA/ParS/Xre antitoxin family protein [Sulfitobacter faviae]